MKDYFNLSFIVLNPESHFSGLVSTTDVIICRESKENLGKHNPILCILETYKECKCLFDK